MLGLPELLTIVILVGVAVWIIRKRNNRIAGAGSMYCTHCGTVAAPQKRVKGSFWIELILWCCFLIPGLIYSVWRLTTKDSVCPGCAMPNMIPVESPKAQAALSK